MPTGSKHLHDQCAAPERSASPATMRRMRRDKGCGKTEQLMTVTITQHPAASASAAAWLRCMHACTPQRPTAAAVHAGRASPVRAAPRPGWAPRPPRAARPTAWACACGAAACGCETCSHPHANSSAAAAAVRRSSQHHSFTQENGVCSPAGRLQRLMRSMTNCNTETYTPSQQGSLSCSHLWCTTISRSAHQQQTVA